MVAFNTARVDPAPRFRLGQFVLTHGAMQAFSKVQESIKAYLARHASGDWGELDGHDINANEEALKTGARLFSAYRLKSGVRIWIITEADRSVTTILLPEEY